MPATPSTNCLVAACAFCHKDATKKCTKCLQVGVYVHYCSVICQKLHWPRDVGADLVMALLNEDLAKVGRVCAEIRAGPAPSIADLQAQINQQLPAGSTLSDLDPSAWAGDGMHPLMIVTSTMPTQEHAPSGEVVLKKQMSESFRVAAMPLLLKVPMILEAINKEHLIRDERTTCLRESVMSNLKRVTALLLKEPTLDPNVQSQPDGSTALVSAVFRGHVEAAEMLLADRRVDCNKTNFKRGSPLIISALHARPDCIRLLLAHPRIDVDVIDAFGRNALHYSVSAIGDLMMEDGAWFKQHLPALCLYHLDCLKLLLAVPRIDLGVRVQYQEKAAENHCSRYFSALALGIHRNLPGCVDLLLARADILVDEDALTVACMEPDNEAGYLGKLLRHGNFRSLGKLVQQWPPGWDAECRRVIPSNFGITFELEGVEPSLCGTGVYNRSGTKLRKAPTVCLVGLLSGPGHGEDLPALSTAARFGRSEHVKALLAAGCPPSGPPGSRGSTPLMCALNYIGIITTDGEDGSDGANDACIHLLLAAPGIDLGARDASGRTALDWARRIPSRGRGLARVRLLECAVAAAASGSGAAV